MEANELRLAVRKARTLRSECEEATQEAAQLLAGHLRCVDASTLTELKRELRGWNSREQEWSKKYPQGRMN